MGKRSVWQGHWSSAELHIPYILSLSIQAGGRKSPLIWSGECLVKSPLGLGSTESFSPWFHGLFIFWMNLSLVLGHQVRPTHDLLSILSFFHCSCTFLLRTKKIELRISVTSSWINVFNFSIFSQPYFRPQSLWRLPDAECRALFNHKSVPGGFFSAVALHLHR